jgi:hypothetical protein
LKIYGEKITDRLEELEKENESLKMKVEENKIQQQLKVELDHMKKVVKSYEEQNFRLCQKEKKLLMQLTNKNKELSNKNKEITNLMNIINEYVANENNKNEQQTMPCNSNNNNNNNSGSGSYYNIINNNNNDCCLSKKKNKKDTPNTHRSHSHKSKSSLPFDTQIHKLNVKINEYLKNADKKSKDINNSIYNKNKQNPNTSSTSNKNKRSCHTQRAKNSFSMPLNSKEHHNNNNPHTHHFNNNNNISYFTKLNFNQLLQDALSKQTTKQQSKRKASKDNNTNRKQLNKSTTYRQIPLNKHKSTFMNMSYFVKHSNVMNNDLYRDINTNNQNENVNNKSYINKSDIFHSHQQSYFKNNSMYNKDFTNGCICGINSSSLSIYGNCGSNNSNKAKNCNESGNSTNANSNHKCKNKVNLRQIMFHNSNIKANSSNVN